ncbi:ubiquitin carboxyl-terminal hydrolase [Nesidiocoris tenuis]|uniref:Ubiquitin carboxyl-terminal hydrolase n=1 Tax=Nesidiocoris tenuis TaxID=355587 RepID=A0ABN7AZA3_9HEMI|nr:ubiquitin carboxyl-terminal hydrolase [Nesidiocoris tenuis]
MSDADENLAELAKHLPKIRIPTKNDKVFKDESVFSFDTADSDTGLYVCLNTFLGFGRDDVQYHFQRTNNAVYLHIKRDRLEVEKPQTDGPERKVTKLAIGIEGGFEADTKYVENIEYSIVLLPGFKAIPYPSPKLPQEVVKSVEAIIEADSATKMAEMEAMNQTWDGEFRVVSKHAANLLQLDNGKKIPPSGWKCEKCDLDSNLWLNLTDGAILCGRKFYDGTGGNEHALHHYRETSYPLAVKLGTITKEGKGDVYSYEEDDMVDDPYLIRHLAHFGINIQSLEKTDKSMAELEVDLNQRYGEWAALQESNVHLSPVYGPGLTGINNMGNSCYLNSVVQLLFSVPDFIDKYYGTSEWRNSVFINSPSDPSLDFSVQMTKLAAGLLSGKYSQQPTSGPEKKIVPPISPHMFKNIVGKGHPEFSTKNQQDAYEFLLHLLQIVQRSSRGSTDPTECFKLRLEDKIECGSSGKVKYTYRTEYSISLFIPQSAAVNQEEVEAFEAKKASGLKVEIGDVVRPHIPLSSCLEAAFQQKERIEQFYSSAISDKTFALRTTRIATFPDYLLIHLKKFMLREDWTQMKLDVSVGMPEVLDLSNLRGLGQQPGEELLPELNAPVPEPQLDQAILNVLIEQGFPLEAAKKAVYFTKGAGIEQASNWAMEHITDPDFSDPFVPPGTESAPKPEVTIDPESIAMLASMGFTEAQATKALKATNNNLERAADWIFCHADELDQEVQPMDTSSNDSPPVTSEKFRDGNPVYRLMGFITHMGPSSSVGHYVCHILKSGSWTIFNDEKVASSENPPKNLGYLYLYRRVSEDDS